MSDEIKIETGVPLPPLSRGARAKYPFRALEVGQSFFVPADGNTPHVVQTRLSSQIYRFRPKRFTTQIVDGGVRCWRIE